MQAELSSEQARVTAETVSADFGVRLVAYLIDAIILAVPNVILQLTLGPVGALIAIPIYVAYDVYFWTSMGQTPGKMAMGLKVVSAETGELLDTGAALLRYVGYIISFVAVLLGFLWVIWDPHHDAWHDKIAKSKVIKLAK